MAAIIQDEKQAAALKEIERELEIIENLNNMLAEEAQYTVTAGTSGSKPAKIELEDKDKPKLIGILEGYKKRLVKDVLSKAKDYRIALSEKETASLN